MALAAVLLGAALTLAGLVLIHPPTALVVGGLGLIFWGLIYDSAD